MDSTTGLKKEMIMTSQEMLERSSSWTLACDNALLNRLKAFSENVSRQSQEISKECDSVAKDVSKLNYRLMNVTNEFLMLSNTQFVENRVEEFEEFSTSLALSESSTVSNSKSKAEKEAELISKMKKAIQLGLTACNDRRKPDSNRFKMKQPHLIGSPKFFSSRYCGLVDENRRIVPLEDILDPDSLSLSENSDIMKPEPAMKPIVTFTMPPPAIFPNQVRESNIANDEFTPTNLVPPSPSPSISNRSSDLGNKYENVPRSVTDELNKIYSSFAPPTTVGLRDDDSDDDFRPTGTGARLFDDEDDDDDLFGEKELFQSSNQRKTNFFERSNPAKLPNASFSLPPPIKPQSNVAFEDTQTLVGEQPETNIPSIPTTSSYFPNDVSSKKEASIPDDKPVPETEGLSRPKLPPGAVSMFGELPPPVFTNGALQAAQSRKNVVAPSVQSKEANKVSSASFGSANILSSQKEDVNASVKSISQPSSEASSTLRAESISQGSLSGSENTNRSQRIPVTSLFADDSSDEDIFSTAKKSNTSYQKRTVESHGSSIPPMNKKLDSNRILNSSVSKQELQDETKYTVKKSIFDDSESDDDLFSSKNLASSSSKNNSSSVPSLKSAEYATRVSSYKQKKTTLFGEESDEEDPDLFSAKSKPNTNYNPSASKSRNMERTDSSFRDLSTESMANDNVISDSVSVESGFDDTAHVREKSEVIDNNGCFRETNDAIVDSHEKEIKTLKSPIGNKISEKIRAMEISKLKKSDQNEANNNNNCEDSTMDPPKQLKPKISVKALALSLNLNPLTMKVGAKPPKQSVPSGSSTPDGDSTERTTGEVTPIIIQSSTDITDGNGSHEDIVPTSPPKADEVDHFVTIIKARPKIQQKRRPPSRVFLKSLAGTEANNLDEMNEGDKRETETTDHDNQDVRKTEELYGNDEKSVPQFVTEDCNISKLQFPDETKSKDAPLDCPADDGSSYNVNSVEEELPQDNLKTDAKVVESADCSQNRLVDCDKKVLCHSQDDDSIMKTDDRKEISEIKSPLLDADSDDDLFLRGKLPTNQNDKAPVVLKSDKKSEEHPVKPKKQQHIKKSIFDDSDSDDDLFSSKAKDTKTNGKNNDALIRTSSKRKSATPKKSGGLFGDDSESDSDLFKSKQDKDKNFKAEESNTSATVKVFGEKASFFDSSDEN